MEEEREKKRVEIREKYNIKKIDESNPYGFVLPDLPDLPDGGMNAKKKTPAELQAEIDAAGGLCLFFSCFFLLFLFLKKVFSF